MFSPERITQSFIKNNDKLFVNLSWKKLFKEIFYTLYFKSHLSKHLYQPYQITICLNKEISVEVLNLLYLLSHKYSFFKLRQSESQNLIINLEENYLLNSNLSNSKLLISNTCFLIGVNPRYEGSKLNLTLRSRYLKGNFKIIQIGSLCNLTFAIRNLSNNTKNLKSLVEGNNLFCQELVNSSNPILISNSELFKRKDSINLTNALKLLIKYINFYSHSKAFNSLNVLNSTLNESGIHNFNILKTVQNIDFKNSLGVYFLNNSFNSYNIKKLLNLKLLNFFQDFRNMNKLLITQNSTLDAKEIREFQKNFNLCNQIHLPNNVFFETSGTYINTNGEINRTTKIITSLNQTKSDWQIIRKIVSYCKKTFYISNVFRNNKLIFNSNTSYHFKNYIGFQYYAISNLNNLAFQLLKRVKKPITNYLKFKPKRNKFLKSQLRF